MTPIFTSSRTALSVTAIIMALAAMLCACSGTAPAPATDHEAEDFDMATLASAQVSTPDLRHYELVGPVKSCRRTTFFNVMEDEQGRLVPDTLGTDVISSTAYFDSIGGYVAKENERLRRDEQGRIVRWEDRHPNVASAHPGFLRDTLAFEFISANLMRATGRGAFNMVMTDDFGNILSQQTVSTRPRHNTVACNVYRRHDRFGNWTERLTLWSTQLGSDSIPVTHYSIDRRKIIYYKQ